MHLLVKLAALAAFWILATRVLRRIKRLRLERQLGAKPLQVAERGGLFGIRFGLNQMKLKDAGLLVDFQITRYALLPNPKAKLFLMKVFGKQLIQTRDPDNLKAMLAAQFEDFCLKNQHDILYPLLGDGVICSDGEVWSHARTMLRPQFSRERISRCSSLEPQVQLLAEHIRNSNGQPFDMQDLVFRFTIDTATVFLFGESSGALGGTEGKNGQTNSLEFAEAFDTVEDDISLQLALQGMPFLKRVPGYKRSLKIIYDFVQFYIDKNLNLLSEKLAEAEESGHVFIQSLCQETRDQKVLREELLTMLTAGRDTTASLLTFTFYELARNEDIWKTLRKEVANSFGSDLSKISYESLKQCHYLRAVINELLRMYPPVATSGRTVRKTTTIPRGGGPDGQSPLLVERGETVAFSVYAMQRTPELYGEDAHIFDPTRWLDDRTKGLGWAFLPFGGGPRVCLGQQFALMEASYAVARLAQMFTKINLAEPDGPYPPKMISHITIKLYEKLFITMS